MSIHADSKPWTVPALVEAKRNGQKLVMLTASPVFRNSLVLVVTSATAPAFGLFLSTFIPSSPTKSGIFALPISDSLCFRSVADMMLSLSAFCLSSFSRF